jgi:hypothetical protein
VSVSDALLAAFLFVRDYGRDARPDHSATLYAIGGRDATGRR